MNPAPPPPMPTHPQPLEYAYLMRRRPPIVTAVGVMSIIVGVATIAACVASLLVAGGVLRYKQVLANQPAQPRVAATAMVVTTGTGSANSDDGAAATTTTAPATNPSTLPTTLPASDVQAALTAIQQHANTKPLTASQLATLRALLEAPGQMLVLPTRWMPAASYVFGADVDEAGTAHVVFMHFIVSISPQRRLLATQPTGSIPGSIVGPVSSAALGLAMAEAVISGLLALFLIVAGVVTLRHSMRGPKMHWAYVAIKLPLAVVAVFVWAWLLHGLSRGVGSMPLMAASPGPTSYIELLLYVTLVLGVAGLIYPIALIFALRSKAANAYYNMVT